MTRLASLAALAAAVTLSGCPGTPELFVTPLSMAFPATGASTQNLRITNTGSGTLTWTATESSGWLTVTDVTTGKQAESISGETTSDITVLAVTVNRAALPLTGGQTTIDIVSNGGDVSIPVTANQAPTPTLSVTPDSLAFGSSLTELPLTLSNTGGGTLTWSIAAGPGTPWISAVPASGSLVGNGTQATVTVRVNRTGLGGGDFTGSLDLTTNAGNRSIAATMRISPFALEPDALDFGAIQAPERQFLTLRNNTASAIQVELSATSDGGDWLTLATPLVTVPTGSTGVQVEVNANPNIVVPGDYTGLITARETLSSFTETAPVTMRVTGLTLAPASIDFGTITAPQSQQVLLTNLGVAPLDFTVNVPVTAQSWLTVTPANGAVANTTPLTVSVDPLAVNPGSQPYTATVTVAFDGGTQSFTVSMTRPVPASLLVNPGTIDFGTSLTNTTIGIWNPGLGTVNWSIDTTTFPTWLTLVPVNGAGVASGTVTGDQTDSVSVRIDRNLAPDDATNFEFVFNVTATGDFTGVVPVTIRMIKPLIPEIVIIGDGADTTGKPFVTFDIDVNQRPLIIRNDGNGPLAWRIDLANKPPWVTSIVPSQGSLLPGVQVTLTLTVDRSTLDYLGAQAELSVLSDDPSDPAAPFLVEVLVPKSPAIGSRQTDGFAFGINANSSLLEIGNIGDPGTILNYQLSTSKEWLSVFPISGSSIGSGTPIIDWQAHSIAIDRSLLEGSGASAVITATAYTVEDGQRVPDPSVDPLEIPVTVEAATLTLETAAPRTRIPSLTRYVMMLRNVRYQVLPIPDSRLADIGNQFLITENSNELELTETNQFLRSASRLRTNMLILLDYSGSMLATARKLEADGQIGDGVTPLADPVQTMYETCIPQFLDELPAEYRVGLAIANERSPDPTDSIRILRGSGSTATFTRDRDVLLARLANANVIDNGATQFLSAVVEAATILTNENTDFGLIPFDDSDVNALVCVTDGRDTTFTNSISEIADYLVATRVRLFTVGFGDGVASNPLVILTQASGGHHYATRTAPTGEVDPFGLPIRKPLIGELVDWFSTDALDECDQSLNKDFRSQVILSYTTLLQEPGVTVENRLTFNDPNDQNSPCLPEQGQISGTVAFGQIDYQSTAGDVRLGQISMNTEGLQPDGTAVVLLRGEYMPRNITSFTFDIDALPAHTVSIVPASRGGMIQGWTETVNGTLYTYTSPDGTALQYGDFGDMLEIRFPAVFAPFLVSLEVVAPERNDGPEAKYFTHPDTITVTDSAFNATAFPRAAFVSNPPIQQSGSDGVDPDFPDFLDLGTGFDQATIDIYNLGGSYLRPGVAVPDPRFDVGYRWIASVVPYTDPNDPNAPAGLPFTLLPAQGFVLSSLTPDRLTVVANRGVPAGVYYADLSLEYYFGSVAVSGSTQTVRIRLVVQPTALVLSTPQVQFGAAETFQSLTVNNDSPAALDWSADLTGLPAWLSVDPTNGSLGPNSLQGLNLTVDRTGLPAGEYSHRLPINSPGNPTQTVFISMTVD
jgi:hypothetical protein